MLSASQMVFEHTLQVETSHPSLLMDCLNGSLSIRLAICIAVPADVYLPTADHLACWLPCVVLLELILPLAEVFDAAITQARLFDFHDASHGPYQPLHDVGMLLRTPIVVLQRCKPCQPGLGLRMLCNGLPGCIELWPSLSQPLRLGTQYSYVHKGHGLVKLDKRVPRQPLPHAMLVSPSIQVDEPNQTNLGEEKGEQAVIEESPYDRAASIHDGPVAFDIRVDWTTSPLHATRVARLDLRAHEPEPVRVGRPFGLQFMDGIRRHPVQDGWRLF